MAGCVFGVLAGGNLDGQGLLENSILAEKLQGLSRKATIHTHGDEFGSETAALGFPEHSLHNRVGFVLHRYLYDSGTKRGRTPRLL